ncbi:MAG TPA: tetratricopeptide repeat protein, partial [Pseudonocardiaceae bacterium]
LVAAEPGDERLWTALATALHRARRTEAAAEACAEGLRVARERGLDAPALRRLQTAVLRGNPPADERPRPFQLPPDVAEFIGREAELAGLVPDAGPFVVAVDGKPGIGKSALVTRLAHELAPRFPDGVLHVDLRGAEPGRLEPVAVLGRFLAALGETAAASADVDAASAAFRSALTGRRVLVVLDNAADAAQVRPLLPAGPGCAVLVTSRRALVELDVTAAVTLDLLSVPEAVTLLGRLAGPGRTAAEPDAAREIVRHCGLLPLAVRIAGARLRARPRWRLAELAGKLADDHGRLAELAAGDLAVLSSFELGYRALTAPDARLFRLLGLLDGADAGVGVAAAVAGLDPSVAEAGLERLVDAQLLESHHAGRYRFHDLLRLFARRCAGDDPPEERAAAVGRAMRWYVDAARRADEGLRPAGRRDPARPDAAAALAWFDAERANLVSAAEQGGDDVAPALNEALLHYFNIRKSWPDWLTVCRAAVAAAERSGDRRAEALAHRHLGMICTQRRRLPAALRHMRRALGLFRELGEREATAKLYGDLGVLHAQLGEHDEAIASLGAALTTSREIGNRSMESVVLNNLGLVQCERSRYEAAARCVEEALAIERDLGGAARAATLESLGTIRLRQGRHREAAVAYRRSLRAARAMDDRWSEAHALRGLGLTAREVRGPAAARPHLRRALAIFTAMKAPEAEDLRRLLDEPQDATGRPSPGRRRPGAHYPAEGSSPSAGVR